MDTEVGQAYHTVQLSTKEMLKNNRRQHYCNMMDLLASSCKASGLLGTSFTDEELVQFWLCDILPLMFDTDSNIQTCAIAAMAEALVALDVSVIHATSVWPKIRSEFITQYTTSIGEMRDAKNSNWHKVWSLLVQIMDDELLRGCTYINKFLSVVELGFRNPDNGVRSEAFLCWRVLIKVFAAYNELAVGKRLRLLLIPLRTSQSRSSHVSGIKLRVWWYLLTCLDEDLPKSFDTAVEYFLSFMYGGGALGGTKSLAQNYQTARELALPCLVALWSNEFSEDLRRLMRELRLETLSQPSPLMRSEVLQQHWRPLLAAAVAGMQLLCHGEITEAEEQMLHLLARNLTLAMFKLQVPSFIVGCCTEIEKTLPADGRVARAVFNTCAADGLVLPRGEPSDYLEVLEAWMKLCIKAKTEVPATVLQRCVSLIFAPEQLRADNQNDFRLLSSFAAQLMQTNDEEDYDAFSVKLHIWRQVSSAFLAYLRENALDYRLATNAALLDIWILWPLQTCAGFAGRRVSNAFDSGFCELWRQLLSAGHNSPERKKFVTDLKSTLCEMLKNSKEEPHFAEFFDAYVNALLKLGICKDAPHYKEAFALLLVVFKRQTLPQPLLEGCLNTLRNLILQLRQNELIVVFDALKPILTAALQCWSKQKYTGGFLAEWKHAIQEKFRKQPMKNMTNQLKELFKGDDLFVIIPAVWSLNPEKLTDRQKERFAEKSDIPALYNDMSQSQDSSIKPWTPKKVVIAKSKQTELALSGGATETSEPILIEDTPTQLTTQPVVVQSPRKRRETIDVTIGSISTEKSSFRKPRALAVEDAPKPREETPVRVTRLRTASAQKESSSSEKLEPQSPNKKQAPASSKTPTLKTSIIETTMAMPMQSVDLFAEATDTQLPAELLKKTSSIAPDTQLDALPEALIEDIIPPAQIVAPELSVQETSPKKPPMRLCNLNSPPDRKQTNNSTSPTLRPKPTTTHLTGRGAQLINMIRNKKLDGPLPYARVQGTPARVLDRAELVATPTSELIELTGAEQTSTPIQAKDLLIFSKRLPSPSASPSASILKRKFLCESIDDMSVESPAFKRKRVSFHDPPVSVTKEYLRDTDESRSKPKRCLQLDKVTPAQTPELKHALKRRSRLDSIIEIEKFAKEQTARTATTDKPLDKSGDSIEDEAFTTLKWNDTTHNSNAANANCSETATSNAMSDSITAQAHDVRDLAIMDSDSALDLVVEQCPLETVLQRFFAKANSTPLKSANVLTRFLSTEMSTNQKLKTNVLETLSENHSKDFLDHAVRENLSSVVCDRLNANSVLDYIVSKSKIQNSCRSSLLNQVPDILKSSRLEAERVGFVQQLLLQCSFNDDQLLDIIGQLMVARKERAHEANIESVAETAADSSSNL